MKSIDKIISMYSNSQEGCYMRFGQWFIWKFGILTPIMTVESNTDLFYEKDSRITRITIEKWLTDHNYTTIIPPIRND